MEAELKLYLHQIVLKIVFLTLLFHTHFKLAYAPLYFILFFEQKPHLH